MSETIVGAALEHIRDEVKIATKFGFDLSDNDVARTEAFIVPMPVTRSQAHLTEISAHAA